MAERVSIALLRVYHGQAKDLDVCGREWHLRDQVEYRIVLVEKLTLNQRARLSLVRFRAVPLTWEYPLMPCLGMSMMRE